MEVEVHRLRAGRSGRNTRHDTPAMSAVDARGRRGLERLRCISRCARTRSSRSVGTARPRQRRTSRRSSVPSRGLRRAVLRTLRATASCGRRYRGRRSLRRRPGHEHSVAADEIAIDAHVGEPGGGGQLVAARRPGAARAPRTSAPPAGSSHAGASAMSASIASSPVGPLTSARRGSQSATSRGSSAHLVLGDVGRVRDDHPQPAAQRSPGARRTTSPRCSRTRVAAEPDPGEVGAGDGQRVVAGVGGPHLRVGQLARQRERDRTRAGAEVGDRVRRSSAAQPGVVRDRGARRAAPPRRSRSAPPPRSPVAARARAGRRGGRARGSPTARARTAAARRRRGARACRRGAAIAGAVAALVLAEDQLDAVVAGHPLDHPARLGVRVGARRCRAGGLRPARAGRPRWSPVGHVSLRRRPSWRLRSSAISASVRSSS